ncbi:hypothetical protein [Roseateles flavus]|uniref:Uncharacterized protein n=1 Tax=Roseateles flavus TaxID=3149041 RepID=A0ABV0GGH9_9BURK
MEVFDQRIDQFGKRSRRRRPASGPAVVFLPEEALVTPPLDAEAETQPWRAGALAALHAFQAHGYRQLIQALPGERPARIQQGLLQRLGHEADVEVEGMLPHVEVEDLPALLRQAAASQGLDLRRAWFLSWDEALGAAARRSGCRSVRLLEPGRHSRRRWPLLRGHVPMRLMEAVVYVLRCDGHLAAGQSLPDPA